MSIKKNLVFPKKYNWIAQRLEARVIAKNMVEEKKTNFSQEVMAILADYFNKLDIK